MNINTQKKSCNRCVAGREVEKISGVFNDVCELGYEVHHYEIRGIVDDSGKRSYGVPQSVCPKPLTQSDFIFAQKNYPASIVYRASEFYENKK